MKRLPHVHHKTAKGKEYVYFDTGLRDDKGRKIFKRLPDKRSPDFPRAYMVARQERERRKHYQPTKTFDWLVSLYEKSPEFRKKAKNTQRSYRHYLGKASALLRDGDGRSVPIDAIRPSDIVTIRDRLADGGGANQALRCLSALLGWAARPERGHIPINPAADIDLFEQGEHEPWPEWLLDEALEDEKVGAAVALLYFTGQRIGDVLKMQWTDIKDDRIVVRQQKRGRQLEVPISTELQAILDSIPRKGFTILTKGNGSAWTDGGLRRVLKAWAKERGQEVVPHGLRKNAVNALLEAGCSSAEVGAITGQTLQMVEHYAKMRDQSKLGRAAIHKLNDARQRRNGKRT